MQPFSLQQTAASGSDTLTFEASDFDPSARSFGCGSPNTQRSGQSLARARNRLRYTK